MKTFYKTKLLMLAGSFALLCNKYAHAQLALDLNGSGNKVTTTYSVNPAMGYTVEFDMYLNVLKNYNAGVTFTCSNKGYPVDFYLDISGNVSMWSGNCASSFDASVTGGLSAGQWYHLAYVYNPATSMLAWYLNGSQIASIAYTQTTSAADFIIGDRADGATNADARYDNLKIWSVVRTPAEIAADTTACLSGSEPGLDVLYRFEEGSGATVYDAALGNGAQDGTISGTVNWVPGVANISYSNVNLNGCMNYTSPSGNYTWVTSGTYMDTIPNAIGCDSIITANLTIDNMPFNTTWSNGYNTGYTLGNGMFLNDDLGWSVYWAYDIPAAYIAKTTDGGATYTYSGIPSSYIGDAAFTDPNTGFACGTLGSDNMIASTTDGGLTWNPVAYPTSYINQLNRIVFNDALNGATAGYGGAMYTTTDGGGSWNYTLIDGGNTVFNDIDYVDNNTIWAVGYEYPGVQGNAFLSTDGGATWTLKFFSASIQNFLGVEFIDPLNGFICGGGSLFITHDGGTTWTTSLTGASGEGFTDIVFGAGKYWLSGSNSTTSTSILYTSTDALSWTPVSLSPATTSSAFHVMVPSVNKVYINGDGLIVGTNHNAFNASSPDSVICAGEVTTLVAEGADSYDWSTGDSSDTISVSPVSSTSYTVTGHSATCSLSKTLLITVLQPSSGTDTQTACNAYTWIDGNTYTSSTNTPTYTLPNAAGCDSVITLNLTINTVDVSVTETDPTLTANAVGALYQWVDCGNGFMPVTGETNQDFTATSNGDYAVIVTQSGCADTSACEAILTTGMNEMNALNVQVYPNPARDNLMINGDVTLSGLKLIDVSGNTVFVMPINNGRATIDLSSVSNGVYLIEITGMKKEIICQKRVVVSK